MNRLYQWLHVRTAALRAETVNGSEQNTIRTEITVQEQERMLVISSGQSVGGAACPFCGRPFKESADRRTPGQTDAVPPHLASEVANVD